MSHISIRNGRVRISPAKNGGAFGSAGLGEIQASKNSPANRICKNHVWRVSKFSKACSRCGIEEDRNHVAKMEVAP